MVLTRVLLSGEPAAEPGLRTPLPRGLEARRLRARQLAVPEAAHIVDTQRLGRPSRTDCEFFLLSGVARRVPPSRRICDEFALRWLVQALTKPSLAWTLRTHDQSTSRGVFNREWFQLSSTLKIDTMLPNAMNDKRMMLS